MSRTFATLNISQEAWNEIAARLVAAGYQYVFIKAPTGTMINMDGIALVPESEEVEPEKITQEQKVEKNNM